jgi:dephospho-CoA kinase
MEKIIAIVGKMGSGKNETGKIIQDIVGPDVKLPSFANKLKSLCMELYGLSRDDLYTAEGKARESKLTCLVCPACASMDCFEERVNGVVRAVCGKCTMVGERKGFAKKYTNRMILQRVGDTLRKIDPTVFARSAMREANGALANGASLVVLTDCRFKSEVQAVREAGGQIWRMRRINTGVADARVAYHVSEIEMDSMTDDVFDAVVDNDGTVEDLRAKIAQLLTK